MSPLDDETRLRDMLDHARRAVEAVHDRVRADLDQDFVLAAALERFVEVVGEAANRVSEQRKGSIPNMPWKQIIGMRNRLVHGYTSVDKDVLWDVVNEDIPALVTRLETELGKQK